MTDLETSAAVQRLRRSLPWSKVSRHSRDTSDYCYWTLTVMWRLQSSLRVIAADLKWLSANQSPKKVKPARCFFFLLFFPVRFYCTGFTFTNRCVAFTMRFKSREDLDQDNSWSHHTFVLQARGEVSFMRRLRRHREKQLMKTKLQFPDAFELLAPLIWLSSFRCQCSYKYRLSHRLTFLLRASREEREHNKKIK